MHVYNLYVAKVRNIEKVRGFSSGREISTGIHYSVPLPFLKAYD